MTPIPTILYVDCRPKVGMERRRLAGMQRYAAALGWGVETLEAMEMIRREACDGLTANSLATRFSWSRHHFDLRFKEAAGHTVLDEILNVRMARATELLANSDIPVSAVAHFCGFKTELAFWKTFSKRIGVAPLRFREARR